MLEWRIISNCFVRFYPSYLQHIEKETQALRADRSEFEFSLAAVYEVGTKFHPLLPI